MSLGDADAKFPSQGLEHVEPPSPSRENPGQVYPKSDPRLAAPESIPGTGGQHDPSSYLGNPYMFTEVLDDLDHSLSKALRAIEGETGRMGSSGEENALLAKFRSWKEELDQIRAGRGRASGEDTGGGPAPGGLFAD